MEQKQATSDRMRACKSKNSSIELALRRALWAEGYRYRINYAKLPGKPDIVLSKPKIVIFCDGEFWHGKDWERRKHDFKANKEFWISKVERTMQRDIETTEKLQTLGWMVLRFWESDINKRLQYCLTTIRNAIESRSEREEVFN
ncbi:very short patch repair endonuclease [Fibrella aquatilis]|uniref:Very short patch repair endonuclease n=1 Tax=Fibrella aquatilis TaxID=2817059 RepID=A0A939GDA7_9BACT|nr:very short patch repair endonuclease [Fibrella aquatilis]MBO0934740.1 very short patch repair endonuclease [Fibrella aquatilis]